MFKMVWWKTGWNVVGVMGWQTLILLDISLKMGSSWAGYWMGRQMYYSNEMQLMVWVDSEWSYQRQKGVAAAVAYIIKVVG